MRNLNCPWLKWSFLSLALLATVLVAKPTQAQGGASMYVNGTEIRGYPQDWSHHHVVFSNIGAEDEALQKGKYEHWEKVVNEPRYVIQQLKNHGEMKGPAGIDAEYRSRWNAESTDLRFGEPDGFVPMYRRMTKANIKTDWSEALGGPGLAGGQYPAKFNLMTTTASCSDYVVFPTGAMGSSSRATIVAFNSVYSGCPLFSGGLPVVYWAYNTGSGYTATTSPTISLDGTQVAFVQTTEPPPASCCSKWQPQAARSVHRSLPPQCSWGAIAAAQLPAIPPLAWAPTTRLRRRFMSTGRPTPFTSATTPARFMR